MGILLISGNIIYIYIYIVKTGDRTREPTTVSFDNPIKQTKHPTFLGTWATDVNQRLVMTRTRWLLDKGQLKPWNKP